MRRARRRQFPHSQSRLRATPTAAKRGSWAPVFNRILSWWLKILVAFGAGMGGLTFLMYLSVGDSLLLQASGVMAVIAWGAHRWRTGLQAPMGRKGARRGQRPAPRNLNWPGKKCRRIINTLATRYMCVRVMWVHLVLSVLLSLWPSWVEFLLGLDALYQIPMMINIITIGHDLPFYLTACALTLLLVPGYAIYHLASFDKADWKLKLLAADVGKYPRLQSAGHVLILIALFVFFVWETWGILLPAQDYSLPMHLTTPIGLILFSILPLYGFAVIAPHLLLSFVSIWRPMAHETRNAKCGTDSSEALHKRQKMRRKPRSARAAAQ